MVLKEKNYVDYSHSKQYRNRTSATYILANFAKICDKTAITLDQSAVRLPYLEYIQFNALSSRISSLNY